LCLVIVGAKESAVQFGKPGSTREEIFAESLACGIITATYIIARPVIC
jgi:hypothetical protein